jgi:hypothetical protein
MIQYSWFRCIRECPLPVEVTSWPCSALQVITECANSAPGQATQQLFGPNLAEWPIKRRVRCTHSVQVRGEGDQVIRPHLAKQCSQMNVSWLHAGLCSSPFHLLPMHQCPQRVAPRPSGHKRGVLLDVLLLHQPLDLIPRQGALVQGACPGSRSTCSAAHMNATISMPTTLDGK